jgi:hypothetical protein
VSERRPFLFQGCRLRHYGGSVTIRKLLGIFKELRLACVVLDQTGNRPHGAARLSQSLILEATQGVGNVLSRCLVHLRELLTAFFSVGSGL